MNTMREPPSAFRASAISERMPPSPLLSMRSRIATYFTVTIMNSAQRISETVPITSSGSRMPSVRAGTSASRKA